MVVEVVAQCPRAEEGLSEGASEVVGGRDGAGGLEDVVAAEGRGAKVEPRVGPQGLVGVLLLDDAEVRALHGHAACGARGHLGRRTDARAGRKKGRGTKGTVDEGAAAKHGASRNVSALESGSVLVLVLVVGGVFVEVDLLLGARGLLRVRAAEEEERAARRVDRWLRCGRGWRG